jgi:hypothetical protein
MMNIVQMARSRWTPIAIAIRIKKENSAGSVSTIMDACLLLTILEDIPQPVYS